MRSIKETKGYVLVDLEFKENLYKQKKKLSILPNLCSVLILGHDFFGLQSKIEIPLNRDRAPLSRCNVAAANFDPCQFEQIVQHKILSLFCAKAEAWVPLLFPPLLTCCPLPLVPHHLSFLFCHHLENCFK